MVMNIIAKHKGKGIFGRKSRKKLFGCYHVEATRSGAGNEEAAEYANKRIAVL